MGIIILEKYYIFSSSFSTSVKDIEEIKKFLNKCHLYNNFIFVVNYKRYQNVNFFKKEIIEEQSEMLLKYKKYCSNNNLNFKLLIYSGTEAPTYKNNLTKYCNYIVGLLDISLFDIIIFGQAEHQYNDNVNFAITNLNSIHIKIFINTNANLLPTHHFVSLSRVAKPHRLYSTIEIINKKLNAYGKVSLCSGFHYSDNESEIIQFLPEKYKNIIPLEIDGQIIGNDDKIFSGICPSIQLAFVNVVQESAYEPALDDEILKIYNINDPWLKRKNEKYKHTYWSVNSFTEKSMKPFAWGQIPLFNCVHDNIKYIRKLGFDLFDDIIDHSYNNISDPISRIDAMLNELKKICQWSIDDCIKYKVKNMSRFIKNREIAKELDDFKFKEMATFSLQSAIDKYNI